MASIPFLPLRRAATALAAGLGLVALAPALPAQAEPTVPGVTVTVSPGEPGLGTLPSIAFTLTTARTLTVTCGAAGRIVANGVALDATCAGSAYGGITVQGTPRADTVTIDTEHITVAARDGSILVYLGAGNDTATVRHTDGSPHLYGEGGNDKLRAGLYGASPHSPEFSRDTLHGGPGDDTLQNLGYLTPLPADDGAQAQAPFEGTTFISGPGADRIWGDAVRWDDVQADVADAITWSGGPGTLQLSTTSAADTVNVRNNGNYGTLLAVTTAGTTRNWTLPTLLSQATFLTLGGNDAITVEHLSRRTKVVVDGGAGSDRLSILPSTSFTWDRANGVVRQTGWADMAYAPATTETVTVTRR